MNRLIFRSVLASILAACCASGFALAADPPKLTRQGVIDALAPYTGPTLHTDKPKPTDVDPRTLTGKVMCGYQGWFNCEGDGAEQGWVHWTKRGGTLGPKNAKIDLWPDVSELGKDEKFDTEFRLPDGSVAQVFSSYKKATVLRHFEWMKTYEIDGVFVQRFAVSLRSPQGLRHNNTVLSNCREGANRTGRAYALMYDLSGMRSGRIEEVMEDFRALRTKMKLCDDAAYLKHNGKPLVVIWGVGFNDKRAYTTADCRKLIEFFKSDKEAGNCSVMLGVPTYWRTQDRDALADADLHETLALADVISPWTVGRHRNLRDVANYYDKTFKADLAWTKEKKIDLLPVVYPGFSWHNMTGQSLDPIPRLKGDLLWSQFRDAKKAGATMVYVAMFDEVDEGTAIFKCVNNVPVSSDAAFVTYEGLPSDYYLRLTGAGGKLLRGAIPLESPKPKP